MLGSAHRRTVGPMRDEPLDPFAGDPEDPDIDGDTTQLMAPAKSRRR